MPQEIQENETKLGCPAKYKTPQELQVAVDNYFQNPPNKRKIFYDPENPKKYKEVPVYGVSGLAYALGFLSRQSLYDYTKLDNAFSYIIKKAKLFIESDYEAALRGKNVAGSIFALKNMGWRDTQSVEVSGNVVVMKAVEIDSKPIEIEAGEK